MSRHGRRVVIGIGVDGGSPAAAARRLVALPAEGGGTVVCANAHTTATARSGESVERAFEKASLVVPDGAPVALAMRLVHGVRQERVDGPGLMWDACELAAARSLPVYLLGGTEAVLAALQERLVAALPTLDVAGAWSPPFGMDVEEREREAIERVNAAGARLVFVGLGAPKQELFMHAVAPHLPGVALAGVGAAFDFHAGAIERAPSWMRRAGLEWLHRLFQEPGRLWKRYLVTNTRFVLALAAQVFRVRVLRRPA